MVVLERRLTRSALCARRFAALLLVILWAGAAFAQAMTFPALTGHVVDQANVMTDESRQALEQKLAALEEQSGIQFVVATLSSLQGQEIEPYANALFRNWALGEKARNNGVLLLVAPNQKKVRIEVGYGLEGTLTDALSKIVIVNAMAPRFKAGDFSGGISRGVDDVITILTTDSSEWAKRPKVRPEEPVSAFEAILPFLIFGLVIFIIWRNSRGGGGRGGGSMGRSGPVIFLPGPGWGGGGGSRGGGGFGGGNGGGFFGGGGSSGGGGASGDW